MMYSLTAVAIRLECGCRFFSSCFHCLQSSTDVRYCFSTNLGFCL